VELKHKHSHYIVRSNWAAVFLFAALFLGHSHFFLGAHAPTQQVNQLSFRAAAASSPAASIRSEHSTRQLQNRPVSFFLNTCEILSEIPLAEHQQVLLSPVLTFQKCRQASHLLFRVFRI
jgi:hypothetical protein